MSDVSEYASYLRDFYSGTGLPKECIGQLNLNEIADWIERRPKTDAARLDYMQQHQLTVSYSPTEEPWAVMLPRQWNGKPGPDVHRRDAALGDRCGYGGGMMTCRTVKLEGGGTAIVCSRGQRPARCSCCANHKASILCDWKVPGGTCSKWVCDRCTTHVGRNLDLCREHAIAWGKMLAPADANAGA